MSIPGFFQAFFAALFGSNCRGFIVFFFAYLDIFSDAKTVSISDRKKEKKHVSLEAKREKKAAKTLAIVTGAFILCWLPFFIMALITPLCQGCIETRVFSFFLWLGYFNSTLNPIIYTVFSPEFRQAFKKLLCGRNSPENYRPRHLQWKKGGQKKQAGSDKKPPPIVWCCVCRLDEFVNVWKRGLVHTYLKLDHVHFAVSRLNNFTRYILYTAGNLFSEDNIISEILQSTRWRYIFGTLPYRWWDRCWEENSNALSPQCRHNNYNSTGTMCVHTYVHCTHQYYFLTLRAWTFHDSTFLLSTETLCRNLKRKISKCRNRENA